MRTSLVGADLHPEGIGLFNWFMRAKGPVSGYTHAMWNGQTTLQFAKVTEKCMEAELSGLYQPVPAENISKYALLKLFDDVFLDGTKGVYPVDSYRTDKTLVPTPMPFDCSFPDYRTMLEEMREFVLRNKKWYGHYSMKGIS